MLSSGTVFLNDYDSTVPPSDVFDFFLLSLDVRFYGPLDASFTGGLKLFYDLLNWKFGDLSLLLLSFRLCCVEFLTEDYLLNEFYLILADAVEL